MSVPRIAVVGEGMLELARTPGAGWQLGQGGDTLNMAIHLARLGETVAYLTALGDDPLSDGLCAGWAAEGLDTDAILRVAGGMPGLYVVHTDPHGERAFGYWRSEAAARTMFALPDSDRLEAAAAAADLLCYSLVTLAILPEAGRRRLLALADAVRARGGRVAFDGNYRARLWPDAAAARAMRDLAAARCDIGLPTLADEAEMGEAGDAAATAARWRALGCGEAAVKLGARGCLVDGAIVPPDACAVVDTSGAGDAFDAGYLHARLAGAAPRAAARAGHRLAGWVIGRSGAIPPTDRDAPYERLR